MYGKSLKNKIKKVLEFKAFNKKKWYWSIYWFNWSWFRQSYIIFIAMHKHMGSSEIRILQYFTLWYILKHHQVMNCNIMVFKM